MSRNVIAFTFELIDIGGCSVCGVPMAMTNDMNAARRRDHGTFYCLNGHTQHYPGKSDVEKLRDELAEKERALIFERERASTNFNARVVAETEAARLKKRAKGGACPCCNRSFVALARHMKTKHPDFQTSNTP